MSASCGRAISRTDRLSPYFFDKKCLIFCAVGESLSKYDEARLHLVNETGRKGNGFEWSNAAARW